MDIMLILNARKPIVIGNSLVIPLLLEHKSFVPHFLFYFIFH